MPRGGKKGITSTRSNLGVAEGTSRCGKGERAAEDKENAEGGGEESQTDVREAEEGWEEGEGDEGPAANHSGGPGLRAVQLHTDVTAPALMNIELNCRSASPSSG